MIIIVGSGCLGGSNSQSSTNVSETGESNNYGNSLTESSTSSPSTYSSSINSNEVNGNESKIVKLLFKNDYVKVYYVGYNEAVAKYNWKFDGVILKDDKYHTIIEVKNMPKIIKLAGFNSPNYVTKFTVASSGGSSVIEFTPIANSDAKYAVMLQFYDKNAGYLVVVPVNAVDVRNAQVMSVEVNSADKTGNEYKFSSEIDVKLADTPLPDFVKASVSVEQSGVYIMDMNSSVSNNIMKIYLTGSVSGDSLNDEYLKILIVYSVYGQKVSIVAVNSGDVFKMIYDKVVEFINNNSSDGNESGTASYKVLGLYKISKNVEPEAVDLLKNSNHSASNDDVLEYSDKFEYMLDFIVNIKVDGTLYNLKVDEYSDDYKVLSFDLPDIDYSVKSRIISLHLVAPIINENSNIVIKLSSGDEVVKTVTINAQNLKPVSLGSFSFSKDGDKIIVDYKPSINENDIVKVSEYEKLLDSVLSLEGYDNAYAGLVDLISNYGVLPVKIGEIVYYVDDISTLLSILDKNEGKPASINDKSISVSDYTTLEKLVTDYTGKFFLFDELPSTPSEFGGGLQLKFEGIIKPFVGCDYDEQNIPVSFESIEEENINSKFINLNADTGIGIVLNAFQPSKMVISSKLYHGTAGDYPIGVLAQINIYSSPSLALFSSSLLGYSILTGFGVFKVQLEGNGSVGYKLPLESGDKVVGKLYSINGNETYESTIINFDTTQHLGLTVNDINTLPDLIKEMMQGLFESSDGHLIIQLPSQGDTLPLPNGDIININDLPSDKLLDYNLENDNSRIDVNIYSVSKDGIKFAVLYYVKSANTELSDNDIKVLVNNAVDEDKIIIKTISNVYTLNGEFNIIGVIVNVDNNVKSISIEPKFELGSNSIILVKPILTSGTSVDLLKLAVFPYQDYGSGLAVVGDCYFITIP